MAWRGARDDHQPMASLTSTGPCFRVVEADNPARLPVETLLVEIGRHEGWDHQGCIPSIRTLVAELEVAVGPRAGERIDVVLEQGYDDDAPWSGLDTWLEVRGEQRVIGGRPSGAGPARCPRR